MKPHAIVILGLILLLAGCHRNYHHSGSVKVMGVKGKLAAVNCVVVDQVVTRLIVFDRSRGAYDVVGLGLKQTNRLSGGRTFSMDAGYDRANPVIDGVEYDSNAGRLFLIRVTDANTAVHQLKVDFGEGTPEVIMDRITSQDERVRKFLEGAD